MIQGNLLFIQCPSWWVSRIFSSRKQEEKCRLPIVRQCHPASPGMSQPPGTEQWYPSATAEPQPRMAARLATPFQGHVEVAQTQILKFKATRAPSMPWGLWFCCCCLFWEADQTNFTTVENHANIAQEEALTSLLLLHTTQIGPPEPACLSVFSVIPLYSTSQC